MKVELENIKLVHGPLSGKIYAAIISKDGNTMKHKVDITNQFIDCILNKYLGTNKFKESEIKCGSAKWELTIKEVAE